MNFAELFDWEKNIQNFMGIQLLVFIQIWPDYNVWFISTTIKYIFLHINCSLNDPNIV